MHARVRANPAYRAVAWNRLGSDAGEVAPPEPDSFGVLVPRDGASLPVVAVDCDTALLFLSLQEPGPLPGFALPQSNGDNDRMLRRLVLDSIIEVERDGTFVSGPDATETLGLSFSADGKDATRLATDALAYGASLANAPAPVLAQKLYAYNRRPMTRELRRRLPDRAACLAFLGLVPDRAPESLMRHWSRGADNSPWLVFSSRHAGRAPSDRPCKLYVGLALDELPDGLPRIADALAGSDALQFKIGADLPGLVRADKLVAYFPTRDALFAAAQSLLPIVAGRAAHAVPFTAEIAADGALSWGADPTVAWLGDRISWRQWICEKLAAALVAARAGGGMGMTPPQFALARLETEGVDIASFMPTGRWTGEA